METLESGEDTENLKVLHKIAARADSICGFEKQAEAYFQ
jgi:hypothetical protein